MNYVPQIDRRSFVQKALELCGLSTAEKEARHTAPPTFNVTLRAAR